MLRVKPQIKFGIFCLLKDKEKGDEFYIEEEIADLHSFKLIKKLEGWAARFYDSEGFDKTGWVIFSKKDHARYYFVNEFRLVPIVVTHYQLIMFVKIAVLFFRTPLPLTTNGSLLK